MNGRINLIKRTLKMQTFRVTLIKNGKTLTHEIELPLIISTNYAALNDFVKRRYGEECEISSVIPTSKEIHVRTYATTLDVFIDAVKKSGEITEVEK